MPHNKAALLVLLFILGCTGPEKEPDPEQALPKYSAPDWTRDETIACINSKITADNQKLLLITMRNVLEREISSFGEHIRNLQTLISFRENFLSRAIEDYTPNPLEEENFINYCAELKIQIELLKIQLFYQQDLQRMRLSMDRLKISLPEDN